VIDNLINQHCSNPTVGIAYIYCNFRRKDGQKLNDLLASILKQLSETKSSLPEAAEELYKRHSSKRTRLSTDELSKTLQSIAGSYLTAFIVVDALDECQMSESCRTRFLDECFALQDRCGAKLFITSRFLPRITERFSKKDLLEIRAKKDDIERYLEGRISKLAGFVQRDRHLQKEIIKEISEAVDGM